MGEEVGYTHRFVLRPAVSRGVLSRALATVPVFSQVLFGHCHMLVASSVSAATAAGTLTGARLAGSRGQPWPGSLGVGSLRVACCSAVAGPTCSAASCCARGDDQHYHLSHWCLVMLACLVHHCLSCPILSAQAPTRCMVPANKLPRCGLTTCCWCLVCSWDGWQCGLHAALCCVLCGHHDHHTCMPCHVCRGMLVFG